MLPFENREVTEANGSERKKVIFMTFSEYFNALYPYLSGGEKWDDFYDGMIGHFIYEEARDACKLLVCARDTKSRYIKPKNPNKIDPRYAQYAHSKHNPQGYKKWLHKRMFEQDTFDKMEEWLDNQGIEFDDVCAACDNLLESIFFNIAFPPVTDGSEVKIPEISPADENGSSPLSENDRKLLKDFHIDFDSILEKCIASSQAEVWFTGNLAAKISNLYNEKWKDRISRFEDIALQADILSTIALLQDFCKVLDPDKESPAGISVRKLRIKLRDYYVKLHPDSFAGIYPYDAFIDDWNDENGFDM